MNQSNINSLEVGSCALVNGMAHSVLHHHHHDPAESQVVSHHFFEVSVLKFSSGYKLRLMQSGPRKIENLQIERLSTSQFGDNNAYNPLFQMVTRYF